MFFSLREFIGLALALFGIWHPMIIGMHPGFTAGFAAILGYAGGLIFAKGVYNE